MSSSPNGFLKKLLHISNTIGHCVSEVCKEDALKKSLCLLHVR